MTDLDFKEKTKALIDSLKSISANYGLGNDGNEFKIITQSNLYYKRTIPSGLTKIDKFRPRRGQMYIELNANRKYTTPLGSHLDYKQYFLYTFNPFGINKIELRK